MTAEQIKQGYGKTMAAQTELSVLLKILVAAIDYCTEVSAKNKHLTKIGEAGASRLKELFNSGNIIMIIPRNSEDDGEYLSDVLMAIWAGLFFYPQLSEERFLIYAESAELLSDLLGGGWFV